jgi:hypothetical protein
MNVRIRAQNIGSLQMGPKTQNGSLLENGSNDFVGISVICREYLPKGNL